MNKQTNTDNTQERQGFPQVSCQVLMVLAGADWLVQGVSSSSKDRGLSVQPLALGRKEVE